MSDWQRVQTLFLAAVDLPAEEQARVLDQECGSDDELRAEVASLLATDVRDITPIEMAVHQEAARMFDAQVLVGERLGIYRIVREIGRGGMGSVYLAVRDDDEFRKQVALKIVRRGMDTADVLERFRYERQILANLEHPYIARLFDGGSTRDGVPFFVMEYIEGRPVDVHCTERRLNTRSRCELFLRILEAVAYAHSNLVVHRDLKPANILITPDGTPKLLDFGVAKLLTGDAEGDRTRTTSIRPYTPWYASPEQVKGKVITTSSDVYSLGIILYELLTGRKAQQIEPQTPAEIERVVCEVQTPRPSLEAHGLSSDLDNIVLMAMRKEPERRYQSVIQFADDLRRFLEGRTVLAAPNSLQYRVNRFVYRNRLQVASAGVVSAALVVGLVISLGQTRRAEASQRNAEAQRAIAVHESELAETSRLEASRQQLLADQQRNSATLQRDNAEKQKALAEQRVKNVLGMAEHTLFDVHDAIAKLPGSIAARRDLVQTMLTYLEQLQQEIGLDDDMRQALCVAYYKIAMIQGDAQGASMQDFEASKANLLKAQALLMPAYEHNPRDTGLMLRLIEVRSSLADLQLRSGHRREAAASNMALLPVAHRLSVLTTCPILCRMQEGALESRIATELQPLDPQEALAHSERAIEIERGFVKLFPDDPTVKQALGSVTAGAAGAYRSLGRLNEAAAHYRESAEARESLLAADPNNGAIRRNLIILYGNYATVLGIPTSPNLDRPVEAREYAAKGIALARGLMVADPNNATARHDLGLILTRAGMIDPAPGGVVESLKMLEEAQGLLEPILKANPSSTDTAVQLGGLLEAEAHRYETMSDPAKAMECYRKSLATLEPFWQLKDGLVTSQYVADEQGIALLEATGGDSERALPLAELALTHAKTYTASLTSADSQAAVLATAWSTLAEVQEKAGRRQQALQSAQTASDLWHSIKQPGLLTAHRHAVATATKLLESPAI